MIHYNRLYTLFIGIFMALIPLLSIAGSCSVSIDSLKKDSIGLPEKVTHAEPLFVDLIRDLGARKGEKEWNVGMGVTDSKFYDRYDALVEYEFAPVNRLGFEVELPFSFYKARTTHTEKVPKNHWEGIKLATQYTFFVNTKLRTSMAVGYIQEFEIPVFAKWGDESFVSGTVYNPFFVVAKRWGKNWHSLIYTGPMFIHEFDAHHTYLDYQLNASIHYMIPKTHNFIGIEVDSEHLKGIDVYTFRPQFKMKIADRTNLGFVFSIPSSRKQENFGGFIRLIYEPKSKNKS